MPSHSGYRPISDYAAIGNLRTMALVSSEGSIDWFCLPNLSNASVFAAILDAGKGGRFAIAPSGEFDSTQQYIGETNVVRTRFVTDAGELSVTDFLPVYGDLSGCGRSRAPAELHRLVRCERGTIEVRIEWSPRFDYGRARTRIERAEDGWRASGEGESLLLTGVPGGRVMDAEGGPSLYAQVRMPEGGELHVVSSWGVRPEEKPVSQAMSETIEAWSAWADLRKMGPDPHWAGEWEPLVARSMLALKLLTHAETGAIAAAGTSSLPEWIGGVRNWDYRYAWIRDSAETSQALFALGHDAEAMDFLHWVERVSESHVDSSGLQVVYGLHGEAEIGEIELEHLEGYRGSRPVRAGNEAARQLQLDVYGQVMSSAYELVRHGETLSPHVAVFVARVADDACRRWESPDSGIWEIRGEPKHYVHSKVMVWVALDRAVRLSGLGAIGGDTDRWRRSAERVRDSVLSNGYDKEIGSFVISYGSKHLDAANLLMPMLEFLPADDPRIRSTIDRTMERLVENDLVYRYRMDDGLPGEEGAFGLPTMWLVDALSLSGRRDEAERIFAAVAGRANHVGLFSEMIDPRTGEFLGNFPQAFTHIGLVNSAIYLAHGRGRRLPMGGQLAVSNAG